jgi:hypothetical protein
MAAIDFSAGEDGPEKITGVDRPRRGATAAGKNPFR